MKNTPVAGMCVGANSFACRDTAGRMHSHLQVCSIPAGGDRRAV